MLGKLTEMEVDTLLLGQSVGRIACTDGERPYITPVTYVYDGTYILGQTREGMKLNVLRQNANVCFEVDVMASMDNWRSVVISGIFQELNGEQADEARQYLYDHVLTLMTQSVVHHHEHEVTSVVDDSNRIKPIMYRIEIVSRTGRFEKP